MTEKIDDDKSEKKAAETVSWGPKLFAATLAVVLVFFYWLLIYSGGVTVHHG